MSEIDAARREDARREALRFLAARNQLAHTLQAVRNGVNREGFDFGITEIQAALSALRTADYAREIPSALGASTAWQATLDGCRLIESGA